MAATNRLFQDFIEFATDADPGVSDPGTLSAPGLADLVAVADPDFVALTLDPDAENGDPEIVWVTAHTASATTATIARAQEGTSVRAHPVGTKVVAALTADALPEIVGSFEVRAVDEQSNITLTSTVNAVAHTVPITIPASWNTWDIEVSATWLADGSVGDQYNVRLDPDGAPSPTLNGLPVVVASGNMGSLNWLVTGRTGTGVRDIDVVAWEEQGSAVELDRLIVAARAVRTS